MEELNQFELIYFSSNFYLIIIFYSFFFFFNLRSCKRTEREQAEVTGTFRVENLKAQIFKDLHKHVEIVSQTFATGEGSNDRDDKERDSSSDDELHVED